jgi:Tfp pilus assembly protein PilV
MQKAGRHLTSQGGFSVVEILVALAVLTFGVVGVYSQFTGIGRMGRDRITTIQARFLAHQELEQLRACSFECLKNWKPPLAVLPYPNHLKFFYQDQILVRPDGTLELNVQVGWDMRSGENFEKGRSVAVQGLKAP